MKTIRALLLAICVVLLPTATPVQAASCKGASHDMELSAGSASPAVTITTTPVRFSAVYADNAGCAPISITVTVSGVGTFPLTASGTTSAGDTEYSRSMTLPAGRRTYFFAATSGEGSGEITVQLTSVAPRELVITAPPPPPPTPKPTPAPTPPPTPPPATPAPTPPPATPPPATAAPRSASTPTPDPDGEPSSPEPSGSPEPAANPTEQPTDSAAPSPDESSAQPSPSGGAVAGPVGPRTEPGQGGPWGAVILGLATIGVFLLFALRRRRDEDSGATAVVTASTSADEFPAVTPLPPIRELVPPVDPYLLDEGAERPAPRPDEVGVPRWLRPSVREARFRDDRNHSPRLDRLS